MVYNMELSQGEIIQKSKMQELSSLFMTNRLIVMYGKCSISSNTLAVRTPKFILKLLFKTFSFSSNSELF